MPEYKLGKSQNFISEGLKYERYEIYLESKNYRKLYYVIVICVCRNTTAISDNFRNKVFILNGIIDAKEFAENINNIREIERSNLK